MGYNTIQLEYNGGVATITLNRPEKRNAISFDLIDDLLPALEEVEVRCDYFDCHRGGQSILFRDGSGESEIAIGQVAGAELAGFADYGAVVPRAV